MLQLGTNDLAVRRGDHAQLGRWISQRSEDMWTYDEDRKEMEEVGRLNTLGERGSDARSRAGLLVASEPKGA